MNTLIKHRFLNGWERRITGIPEGGNLTVNVVFTDMKDTLAALRSARALARDLGARIRVIAALEVPFTFSLDHPPAAAKHLETILAGLASRESGEPAETAFHLYLCRDQMDTVGHVLEANSLVIIGGRSLWPNDAGWIASMLRSVGHQVLFVRNKTVGTPVSPAQARTISRQEMNESCARSNWMSS